MKKQGCIALQVKDSSSACFFVHYTIIPVFARSLQAHSLQQQLIIPLSSIFIYSERDLIAYMIFCSARLQAFCFEAKQLILPKGINFKTDEMLLNPK